MKFTIFIAALVAASSFGAQAETTESMTFVTQNQELHFKRHDQIQGDYYEHSESDFQFAQDFKSMADTCIAKLKLKHRNFDATKASVEMSRNYFVGVTSCSARIAKADVYVVRTAMNR